MYIHPHYGRGFDNIYGGHSHIRKPWEDNRRIGPRGDKDLLEIGRTGRVAPHQRPLIQKAEAKAEKVAEKAAPNKKKRASGNTWNRLMSMLAFPDFLNAGAIMDTGRSLLNSFGQEYGTLLTPQEGHVEPEVKQLQKMAEDMMAKVGGDALKEAGLDLKVNLYSSDRVDAFTRINPNKPKKSFFQKIRGLFGSEEETEFVEIGLTAGALRNIKSEDELAWFMGRQVAKALGGDHSFTVNNMVKDQGLIARKATQAIVGDAADNVISTQGSEVAADAQAFQMMTKAGFDPGEGLKALESLCRHEEASANSLTDALGAAISAKHHQGVRMALGQMNVEFMRRTEASAHPKAVHKNIPESLLKALPSETVKNPLTEIVSDMATAYAKKDLVVETDGVLTPPGSSARDEMMQMKWNAEDAGDAIVSGLEKLKDLEPQQKMEKGLALIQSVSAVGWHHGSAPAIPEKVTEFFAEAKGWSADSFVKTLKESGEKSKFGTSAAPDFAFQVLLNPNFQKAVAPLMDLDPEFGKLFKAAPDLLTISKDGSENSVHEQLSSAVGFLVGQERREDYPMHLRWPAGTPMASGPLNDLMKQGVVEKVKTQKIEGREQVRDFSHKLDGALDREFAAVMTEALAPSAAKLSSELNTLIAKPKLSQEDANSLFELTEMVPLNADQQFQLASKIVSTPGDTIKLFDDQAFTQNKAWGKFLGQALSSEVLPAEAKEKVFKTMVASLPSHGVRGHEPGVKELIAYTSSKTNDELMTMIDVEIANNGIGSELDEYGEAATNANPVMSIVGASRELSTRVASETNQLQFDRMLSKIHSEETHRLDAGTRRFLLDSMVSNQKKETKLSAWLGRVNTIVDDYTLELNPDLKPRLQEFLVPTLEKMEGVGLRAALDTEPVLKILNQEQSSDLLIQVLQPESMKGQDEKLRTEILSIEKQFGLGNKPGLKKAFYVQIAEDAKLQPHNIDYVLPNITEPSVDMAKTLDKEIRGLSALVAAARTRPAKEQLDTIEYLMGRNPDLPPYFETMQEDAYGALAAIDNRIVEELQANGASASVLMEGLRNYLQSAGMEVRTAVAASFLAGPSGLLGSEGGQEFLLETFLDPVKERAGEAAGMAVELIRGALKAEKMTVAAVGGYLLAQKPKEFKPGEEVKDPTMGEMLHHTFGGYGTPGKKFEQYLAFSRMFAEFEEDFAKSQDNAREMTYFDGVKLIQHHYPGGDKGQEWPKERIVETIIGNGSVNVAVLFTDIGLDAKGKEKAPEAVASLTEAEKLEADGESRVVQMPIPAAEVMSNYDFHRLFATTEAFLENPKMKEDFGFMSGVLKFLKDSVGLEFDRAAAFKMQKDVYPFYKRKVGKWEISAVPAHLLEGDAIVMGLASGKTARKILKTHPEVYKDAMKALGSLEMDAISGLGEDGSILPGTSHANADFHDGQVLIDIETNQVWILDFAQCVPITNEDREYALDLLTIVAKARGPEKAREILSERAGVDIPIDEMKKMMESDNIMDVFIKIAGHLANEEKPMPISVSNWVQMANRRRALGEKIGDKFMLNAKIMGASHMLTGSVAPYNAVRLGLRNAKKVWGDLVGGASGIAGKWFGGSDDE